MERRRKMDKKLAYSPSTLLLGPDGSKVYSSSAYTGGVLEHLSTFICIMVLSPTLAASYSKAQIDPALHQVDLKQSISDGFSSIRFSVCHNVQFQRSKVLPTLYTSRSAQRAQNKKPLTPPLFHQPDVFTQKRNHFFRVSQLESRLTEYRR